ncbi:glycoside hydrolase family 3 N-terminal domain-containing protein [Umezawaea sp. Da 62-37]|uniref:glycoside hydrolase family 3 N-terminal domain-containing protein n=1 Tax=Umezawaea sp. Da 62-37 TaxID=3075927 RepID=UPI0028F6F0C1|nr:glycoside hydrolase family 3 N-terminal domain-containing protein [Umezawaea sp. Da 62-37]WNV90393.1 glycoside hydrolase family 3 N-terminal domain-containing protein [Umezawaea sp. Da 62-37]
MITVGALIAAAVYHDPDTDSGSSGAVPVGVLPPGGGGTAFGPAIPRNQVSPAVDPCAATIAGMPLRRRVAQLVQVGVRAEEESDALTAASEQVGGIFLAGDATGLLTSGRIAEVKAITKLPLTVSVDDEGGRVQRVDELDGDIPSARRMAATMSPVQVRVLAKARGEALRTRGVTMDLAPVVDTSSQPDRAVIGDRAFSSDPAVAREYAAAFASGLRDAGIQPVLKHFPGHGNAIGDSHAGLATTAPLTDLRAQDLVPYRDIGAYGDIAVMVGHLDVPGLTDGAPASLNPAAYRLLRDEFAFDGVAMTDDLGAMRAVTDRVDLPDAVLGAISAGADVALWSSGGRVDEVLDHLEQAATTGRLTPDRLSESLHRVLRSKAVC